MTCFSKICELEALKLVGQGLVAAINMASANRFETAGIERSLYKTIDEIRALATEDDSTNWEYQATAVEKFGETHAPDDGPWEFVSMAAAGNATDVNFLTLWRRRRNGNHCQATP